MRPINVCGSLISMCHMVCYHPFTRDYVFWPACSMCICSKYVLWVIDCSMWCYVVWWTKKERPHCKRMFTTRTLSRVTTFVYGILTYTISPGTENQYPDIILGVCPWSLEKDLRQNRSFTARNLHLLIADASWKVRSQLIQRLIHAPFIKLLTLVYKISCTVSTQFLIFF